MLGVFEYADKCEETAGASDVYCSTSSNNMCCSGEGLYLGSVGPTCLRRDRQLLARDKGFIDASCVTAGSVLLKQL